MLPFFFFFDIMIINFIKILFFGGVFFMQGVLLGSKHFVGKDGTPWSIYYVMQAFDKFERATCIGCCGREYWTHERFDVQPNDKVELFFDSNNSGKAVLSKMVVLGKEG
ncbi:MAG: hypothetical protein H9L35_11245 [Acinetobacter sp.]|uniref:hypothetical protein n=1 Tax=Acinetobacter sp. TaxID=472 RepID=UPI0019879C7D|nr:hypothetical protein [Acinetobacter sp.]MBC6676760.1 hypothetical protein [Acinetobacter sp.]